MSRIKHAVWPTPVPLVYTGDWDQPSWDAYASIHRPSDYHGGMHDAEAWEVHCQRKAEEYRRAFYAAWGITVDPLPVPQD